MSKVELYRNNSKRDDYHLGKLVFDAFSQNSPEDVCQIDAWTGKKETYGSQLLRSVKLASCFSRLGLKPGDVLAIEGGNHLDIHIPFYAALFHGLPIIGVDPLYKFDEVKKLFTLTRPKIVFCQREMVQTFESVAQEIELDMKIFTFEEGENSMANLIQEHGDDATIENFQWPSFDLEKVYAWLMTTSGTTGNLKVAAFQHKVLVNEFVVYLDIMQPQTVSQLALSTSTVQWISSYVTAIAGPFINHIKLMSSGPKSVEHTIDIINEYRPVTWSAPPSMLSLILNNDKKCDLTCIMALYLTGSKIHKDLILKLKGRIFPYGKVIEVYGQTETIGAILQPNPDGPIGSCGVPRAQRQLKVKLIDTNTGKEVTEPNVPGELLVKGPCFAEYYNDPKATAEAFTEDGWYKSGDLLQRDEKNNYFFVDRLKTLIKYQGNTIMPPELEELIMTLDGVRDVAVTSIPHPEDCERTVACVVRSPGSNVTAREIKELIASTLSPKKQLHGGVVFLDELPTTSSGKVHRAKLKQIVLTAERL